MKKLFFSLPCTLALSALMLPGCGANPPAADSTTAASSNTGSATATDTTEATSPAAAVPAASSPKLVIKTTKKTITPDLKGAPDKRYRVVAEVVGQPPDKPPISPQVFKEARALLKSVQTVPPTAFKVADKVRLGFVTSRGSFVVELNGKEAPLHTKSFVYLARRGFFDGTVFHRKEDLTGMGGNIVQGGDPLTKKPELADLAGQGGPGYQIPREQNKLTHQELVIAAARTQDPNSAGSQFYITQGPTEFLDQGDGYTVFGRVVEGKDAAMALEKGDKLLSVEVMK